jgi:hypothetical protein
VADHPGSAVCVGLTRNHQTLATHPFAMRKPNRPRVPSESDQSSVSVTSSGGDRQTVAIREAPSVEPPAPPKAAPAETTLFFTIRPMLIGSATLAMVLSVCLIEVAALGVSPLMFTCAQLVLAACTTLQCGEMLLRLCIRRQHLSRSNCLQRLTGTRGYVMTFPFFVDLMVLASLLLEVEVLRALSLNESSLIAPAMSESPMVAALHGNWMRLVRWFRIAKLFFLLDTIRVDCKRKRGEKRQNHHLGQRLSHRVTRRVTSIMVTIAVVVPMLLGTRPLVEEQLAVALLHRAHKEALLSPASPGAASALASTCRNVRKQLAGWPQGMFLLTEGKGRRLVGLTLSPMTNVSGCDNWQDLSGLTSAGVGLPELLEVTRQSDTAVGQVATTVAFNHQVVADEIALDSITLKCCTLAIMMILSVQVSASTKGLLVKPLASLLEFLERPATSVEEDGQISSGKEGKFETSIVASSLLSQSRILRTAFGGNGAVTASAAIQSARLYNRTKAMDMSERAACDTVPWNIPVPVSFDLGLSGRPAFVLVARVRVASAESASAVLEDRWAALLNRVLLIVHSKVAASGGFALDSSFDGTTCAWELETENGSDKEMWYLEQRRAALGLALPRDSSLGRVSSRTELATTTPARSPPRIPRSRRDSQQGVHKLPWSLMTDLQEEAKEHAAGEHPAADKSFSTRSALPEEHRASRPSMRHSPPPQWRSTTEAAISALISCICSVQRSSELYESDEMAELVEDLQLPFTVDLCCSMDILWGIDGVVGGAEQASPDWLLPSRSRLETMSRLCEPLCSSLAMSPLVLSVAGSHYHRYCRPVSFAGDEQAFLLEHWAFPQEVQKDQVLMPFKDCIGKVASPDDVSLDGQIVPRSLYVVPLLGESQSAPLPRGRGEGGSDFAVITAGWGPRWHRLFLEIHDAGEKSAREWLRVLREREEETCGGAGDSLTVYHILRHSLVPPKGFDEDVLQDAGDAVDESGESDSSSNSTHGSPVELSTLFPTASAPRLVIPTVEQANDSDSSSM